MASKLSRGELEDMAHTDLVTLTQACVAELSRRALREREAVESRGRERDRNKGSIGW